MPELTFKSGIFQKFRTLSKIHLGSVSKDLPEMTEVEFDGIVLRWGNENFNVPTFVGALRAGWAVPVFSNISQYIPQPAGVQLRPATTTGKERGELIVAQKAPSEEERLVGTLDEFKAKRSGANNTRRSPEAAAAEAKQRAELRKVAAVAAEANAAANKDEYYEPEYSTEDELEIEGVTLKSTKLTTNSNRMTVISDDQEAVPVAKIGSPAEAKKTILADGSQAVNAVRMAEATRPVRAQKIRKPSSTIITEGESISDVHPSGATGDVADVKTGDDLSELLPDAASSGMPKPTSTVITWERTGTPQERAERAVLQYGKDKNSIRQILGQETEQTKRIIRGLLKQA